MPKWDPAEYSRHSAAQAAWAGELMDKLDLSGDESVLDIGCGQGRVTAQLAGMAAHGSVLGVDNSPEMIAFARREFSPEAYPNLSFQEADARDLRLERRFQAIFSNAALHWIRDHRPVLASIRRCLEPGGRVLLQMGGKGNGAEIFGKAAELIARPQWREYFRDFEFPYGFHGPEEYQAWAREAGLRDVQARLIPKDMTQEGFKGLAGWLRTTWLPYSQRVPQELREELVREMTQSYIEAYPLDSQGLVHVAMVRLEVSARG